MWLRLDGEGDSHHPTPQFWERSAPQAVRPPKTTLFAHIESLEWVGVLGKGDGKALPGPGNPH